MRPLVFTIEEAPFGWQRTSNRRGQQYQSPRTRDFEKRVKDQALDVMRRHGIGLLTGAVRMEVVAYYAIPASAPKYKQRAMAEGVIRPTVKPDADNVAKAIKDALNKTAYRDDSQIAILHVEKWYAATPRVVVIVEAVRGEGRAEDCGGRAGLRGQPDDAADGARPTAPAGDDAAPVRDS